MQHTKRKVTVTASSVRSNFVQIMEVCRDTNIAIIIQTLRICILQYAASQMTVLANDGLLVLINDRKSIGHL